MPGERAYALDGTNTDLLLQHLHSWCNRFVNFLIDHRLKVLKIEGLVRFNDTFRIVQCTCNMDLGYSDRKHGRGRRGMKREAFMKNKTATMAEHKTCGP